MNALVVVLVVLAVVALIGALALVVRPPVPQPATRARGEDPTPRPAPPTPASPTPASLPGFEPSYDVEVGIGRRLRAAGLLGVTILVIAGAVGVVLGIVVFAAGFLMNTVLS